MKLPAIISPLPNTLANGQTADAIPLMADLNWIVNQVNANAAALADVALTNAANSFTAVNSGVAATSGSNFPIASQVQNAQFNTLSSVAGTANSIQARVSGMALTAYTRGQVFTFAPTISNNSSAAINIDGLGSAVIFQDGVPNALNSGMLEAQRIHLLRYSTPPEMMGTGFQLLNPSNLLGGWVPTLTFATPGNLNVVYSSRSGFWMKIGRYVIAWFDVETSTFTHTTANGQCRLTGLPFAAASLPGTVDFVGGGLIWQGITKANYTQISPRVQDPDSFVSFVASGSAQADDALDEGDMPTAGDVRLTGMVVYPVSV